MHQTLRIPEILLNIFGHILSLPHKMRDRNMALVVLARTCKAFQEPALDVLWEELYDLSPLLRCLPEACRVSVQKSSPCSYHTCVEDVCYSFTRPLKVGEWNTLQGYTRRVRFVHGSFESVHEDTLREVFSLAPSDAPLFPHLRSLYWRSGPELAALLHIAVPSLTILHLDFSYLPIFDWKTFDTFGHCVHIKKLLIDIDSSGFVDSAVSLLVCRLPNLQEVVCPQVALGMDAILHLSSVPNLKRLEFIIIGNHLIQDISHLGSTLVFSNLTVLIIRSRLLDTITSILRHMHLPKIDTLAFPTSKYVSRLGLQEFWSALRETCSPEVLTRLELCGSSEEEEEEDWTPLDEGVLLQLTMEDLRPCTAFTELRELYINFDCRVNLTDTDVLELAPPCMETLYINSDWCWQLDVDGGGITLDGLVRLLRQCPSLYRACLAIDTRTFTEIPEGLDVSFPMREKLLFLDFVDSELLPEFVPGLVSVFAALKLTPDMIAVSGRRDQELADVRETVPTWNHVLDGLERVSGNQTSLSGT